MIGVNSECLSIDVVWTPSDIFYTFIKLKNAAQQDFSMDLI